jgi:hypothetical protein
VVNALRRSCGAVSSVDILLFLLCTSAVHSVHHAAVYSVDFAGCSVDFAGCSVDFAGHPIEFSVYSVDSVGYSVDFAVILYTVLHVIL